MTDHRSHQEKRRSRRIKTRLRSGILRQLNHKKLADCVIHDLSRTGARVVLHEAKPLPTPLLLEDETDGVIRTARIVYVHHNGIGLEFLDTARVQAPR